MRLEDLNWMDVEKYLQHEDRLMLVTGATEQHGYLSLLTDIKIPLALADSASQATGVLVAPPLNFGSSPYFLSYPGTLSLRVSTLIAAVEDIVRSAYGHGFQRILIINGHGGNSPARGHLHEVNNDLPDLKLNWYDWWLSHSIEAVAVKHNIKPSHANWLEAFSFTVVGEMPKENKVPPKVPRAIVDSKTARRIYGDGSFGGPYRVSDEIMHEIFAAALNDILQMLKFD
ncbi:MAG: creatininase family protein [Chloroflexi bacterium]|nr:creatininase family protein [Chloroflexota bacterium]